MKSTFTSVTMILVLMSSVDIACAEEDNQPIRWRDYTVQPGDEALPTIRVLRDDAAPEFLVADDRYVFLQFKGPITESMKTATTALGIELLEYTPENAFLARAHADALQAAGDLPFVANVMDYQPQYRVSRSLVEDIQTIAKPRRDGLGHLFLVPNDDAPTGAPQLRVEVVLFKGVDGAEFAGVVKRLDIDVVARSESKLHTKFYLLARPNDVLRLAHVPGVMWIEKVQTPRIRNEVTQDVIQVKSVQSALGLRGAGEIVAVLDTGLDSGVADGTLHDDFQGRVVAIKSWPVQSAANCATPDESSWTLPKNIGVDDGAADKDSGHGTHVSGTTLGNGRLSGGALAGVAPEARLVMQAAEQYTECPTGFVSGYFLTGLPLDMTEALQHAWSNGARVHSNSWGSDDKGKYSSTSKELDNFVWQHPEMLVVCAAGNAAEDRDRNEVIDLGDVGSPATAKNCLTVGASESNRPTLSVWYDGNYPSFVLADRKSDAPHGLAAYSSRGPTKDGRIKPDVVAPGTMILSTRSRSSRFRVLRHDNMENASPAWTGDPPWVRVDTHSVSGQHSWHDSPAGNYQDNLDIAVQSPLMDLSSPKGSKSVTFWYRCDLGFGDDVSIGVKDSVHGYGSVTLGCNRSGWQRTSVGLGPWSDGEDLRVSFRLRSDGDGSNGDGLYVDDVQLNTGRNGDGSPSDFGVTVPSGPIDSNYFFMGGTSMATPAVAGAAALVREYYRLHRGSTTPSAALIRATLINGAINITPGQYAQQGSVEVPSHPGNVQGWGRVDLLNALAIEADRQLSYVDVATGLSTNDRHEYRITVGTAGVPLDITMVYHDRPGPSLINDLDLSVTGPAGAVVRPNGLRSPDPYNNVERVRLDTLVPGVYTVLISARNVPDGPQTYALVAIGEGSLSKVD